MNNSPLPEWMRPDQCKAIVMLDRMRWRDQPVVLAVSEGRAYKNVRLIGYGNSRK